MSPFESALYFIVLLGTLIFVHELGHFLCAKYFNVKVLRFAFGFGPKLIGIRRGETEYCICAIPLGGYVKMVGEDPADIITPEDQARAFTSQKLWKRFVIVVAGPVMNLALPVLIFFLVFLTRTEADPSTIGSVLPDQPAERAGLRAGDRVVAVDGDPIRTFGDLQQRVDSGAGKRLRLTVRRGARTVRIDVTPVLQQFSGPLGTIERGGLIGVTANFPRPVIGLPDPQGPAARAGLRSFDLIAAIDGRPIRRWVELERALEKNQGEAVRLSYLRPRSLTAPLDGGPEVGVLDPGIAVVVPDQAPEGSAAPDAGVTARFGFELADRYVAVVGEGMPEWTAGLRDGDQVLSVDGRTPYFDAGRLRPALEQPQHTVVWRRGSQQTSATFRLHRFVPRDETTEGEARDVFHAWRWVPFDVDPQVPVPFGTVFVTAATDAVGRTGDVVRLIGLGFVRMVQGRVSTRSIGGPVAIYKVATQAAERGLGSFLFIMAFISINLGLLNLLPIPVLDGGHLLFFGIEAVSRRPASLKVREIATMIGLSLILLLVIFAFKNDIQKLLQ